MKLTNSEFVNRAKLIHGNLYDYTLVDYSGFHNKVKIICSIHGDFEQRAKHHIGGSGCPKCGIKTAAQKCSKWTDEEIKILKDNYPANSLEFCANLLNRCSTAVTRKIREIKLITPIKRKTTHFHPYIKNFFWKSVVSGAKNRNLDVRINIDDVWNLFLKQNKKCALTGWKISFGKNSRETTASLDRIDSSKGYYIDNVQLVEKSVNRNKLDSKESDLFKMCKAIYMHRKNDFQRNEIVWENDIWNDTEYPITKII